MKKWSKAETKQFFGNAVRVVLGCILYGIGFQYFLYHNAIPTGGITGIAMILNFLTDIPVGVLVIAMNIPLFLIAWKALGLRFMLATVAGMVLLSVSIDLLAILPICITKQPMLACLFAGVFCGIGLGLVYSTGATTGGVDVIAKLLRRKYQYINFGTLMLVLDMIVILAFAAIFGNYDSVMYALITMFVYSKLIDFVLYGALTCKMCYIISDASEEVKNAIVYQLDRGVTILNGRGAYSGNEKQVLLCVVKRHQVVELRRLVRETDEKAFLIFTDAHDVYGEGFTNLYSSD